MGTASRVRRFAATTIAAFALATSAMVITAPEAAADSGGTHPCGDLGWWQDNGLVNDVVHHAVEPLLPGLHETNCTLQGVVDSYACLVKPLMFLHSKDWFPGFC